MFTEKESQENKESLLNKELKVESSDTVLMQLISEPKPLEIIDRFSMRKLESDESLRLNSILATVPGITSAVALNQSFRIIIPPGLHGHLMQLVKDPAMSGLLTTSILGESGQIVGSAGLASMSFLVLPMVVWTVLAFLTGQFFLTHIRRNTQKIFEELQTIMQFLIAKEESDLRARIEFLRYVNDNLSVLGENADLRVSTSTNLQKANIESLSGLKLWIFSINTDLKDISSSINLIRKNQEKNENTKKVLELIGKVRENINRAVASWQCYSLGSILNIQLTSSYKFGFLNYVRNSLIQESEQLKAELSEAQSIWHDIIRMDQFINSQYIEVGQLEKIKNEFQDFSRKIDNSMETTDNYFESIKTLENSGINLLFYRGNYYIPSKVL